MVWFLIKLIPIAIAGISPLGLGIVILLLTSKNGFPKALAFVASQAFAFTMWGVIFLNVTTLENSFGVSEPTSGSIKVHLLLGILLLVTAVRIYLTSQDPEDMTSRMIGLLEHLNTIVFFFLNTVLSLFQVRFLMLVAAGTEFIMSASFEPSARYLGLGLLILAMLLSQIIPFLIYFLMRGQREQTLFLIDKWMKDNAKIINSLVLGIMGGVLVLSSLIELLGG